MKDRSALATGIHGAPPLAFSIVVESGDDGVTIAPRGELDLATVERLRDELDAAIRAGFTRIEIDLRGVDFLDSTGLHTLVSADSRAKRDGWTLAIIPGSRSVQRLFQITGMLGRLPFTTNGRSDSPRQACADSTNQEHSMTGTPP